MKKDEKQMLIVAIIIFFWLLGLAQGIIGTQQYYDIKPHVKTISEINGK